jgi:hypothetical protein
VTRTEMIARLRELGYGGPVSYGKARLEELIAEQTPSQDDGEPQATTPVDDFDTGTVKLHEWNGVTKGDTVHIKGEQRTSYSFLYFFESPAQRYVAIRGGKKGHSRDRYITPELILDVKRRPVCKEAS